jgi:hypothetical protein
MQHTHPFSNNVAESPELVVKNWVARISVKQSGLGGNRICPFARMPRVISVEKLCLEDFVKIDSEITIYMETAIRSSYEYLEILCRQLKGLNPDYVFLPDHPHKSNYIKEHETGNGVFPCIIVQTKQELDSARNFLTKTDYYQHWKEEYLNEIRSFD